MYYQEENILATVKLTEEEFKDINMLYFKYIRRGGKKRSFSIAFVFVLIFLIVFRLVQNLSIPTSGTEPVIQDSFSLFNKIVDALIPLVILLAVLGIYLFLSFFIKKSAGKEFSSNKLAQKETNYVLSTEYIEIESEDFHMKLKYEDIHKVLVTKNFIILLESEKLIRILPKRSFENEKAATDAIQLLEAKVSKGKYETYNL